jgi:hypothetical protein
MRTYGNTLERFENPLYHSAVRPVSALLGAVGIVVLSVISALFLVRRPTGTFALQGLLFLALGVFALAMIPVFVASARKSLPVLIGVADDRILGWKSGQRDGPPQLCLRFGDVRVLADYRTQSFPLFPVPTIVSRRAQRGVRPISHLVVDGIDSPEAFTLTPENFDRFVEALKLWICRHPGSEVEGAQFTPESLRARLGLPGP